MFLPVFVHPGKRGPSPVKKSPEKSTAKGGPPAPPPATSSTPPSRPHLSSSSHGLPPPPLPTPGQSNACLSLHSLVARKKNIYVLPPAPTSPRARPLFSTHVRESIAPAYTHAYTRAYTPSAQVRACGVSTPPRAGAGARERVRRRRTRGARGVRRMAGVVFAYVISIHNHFTYFCH